MTDDARFALTRRRLLAGMGTVGATAVGAGAGTSAYFSDEESYDGNSLVAGQLDLKMDWEEHYSDWSTDENDDRTDDFGGAEGGDFDVVMTGGDPANVPDGHVGLPVPMAPQIAVPEQYLDDFMRNTSIEAFPDEDDDGLQDVILTRNQISKRYTNASAEEVESRYRAQFADLSPALDSDARTESSRGEP
ncbi:MAG: SipW-dependent-type signal peptide-containing protein, partial [Halobaculum sp.]